MPRPHLHFAHANGYPPAAYQPLFDILGTRYEVVASPARPLWPNETPDNAPHWTTYTHDLIAQIEGLPEKPVIGVGHSLGAVNTLDAALQRPDLFRAIVLLDPVIFIRPFLWFWQLVKGLGLGYRLHPLIQGAVRRRRVFASATEMYERYRRAAVFSRLNDEALQAYVNALARPRSDGQVELAYSPDWEAHIYYTGPPDLWSRMAQLRVPMLLIYGLQSDTFSPRALSAMRRVLPTARYVPIDDAGHLVPMEKPTATAEAVFDFLNQHMA